MSLYTVVKVYKAVFVWFGCSDSSSGDVQAAGGVCRCWARSHTWARGSAENTDRAVKFALSFLLV